LSRKLDDLHEDFRRIVFEFLARLVESDIHVRVIDTLRSPEEQADNIARGVSWTPNSKHLTGRAIDVCPYALYSQSGPDKLNWDANDPIWQRIGEIGESLGLVWGGRWTKRDMGHLEMPMWPPKQKE
jgi:peptidoglycan L-alanyl-D-glutamate endopeptidase CwlK